MSIVNVMRGESGVLYCEREGPGQRGGHAVNI